MSIWKVLLIWLTSLAGTACIGFLLAAFLATAKEADLVTTEARPPRSAIQAPSRSGWHWVIAYVLFSSVVQYLVKIAPWMLWILGALICGMFAFIFIRGLVLCRGTRHSEKPLFCAKAAAVCAAITAASGFALWQFN